MQHLACPGAWRRGGLGGDVTGVCYSGLMAVVADHPDRAQAPALARQAEIDVLNALAEQRRARDATATGRSLLDSIGPRESFTPCAPDGDLDLSELLA